MERHTLVWYAPYVALYGSAHATVGEVLDTRDEYALVRWEDDEPGDDIVPICDLTEAAICKASTYAP